MKKVFLGIIILLSCMTILNAQSDDMPVWVKKIPTATGDVIYFVGKSEGAEKHENYIVAKADKCL